MKLRLLRNRYDFIENKLLRKKRENMPSNCAKFSQEYFFYSPVLGVCTIKCSCQNNKNSWGKIFENYFFVLKTLP
eukprot:TRINITY_DN7581_c0_g1_i1.p1 TRINITY_DN7581_c0_g1~~TRINITY_DN7581_c0_g1_i1.p1  ORF type:complete len:75 (+),score=8.87 TRINITY_DN7581_c0_g1_i1:291-515(+)